MEATRADDAPLGAMSPACLGRVKSVAARAGLLLFGIAVGLSIAETMLRFLRPDETFGAGTEMPWMRTSAAYFEIDPDFGFRPAFGDYYSGKTGAISNDYPLTKRPGVERVLYIGDSVTRRGRIVEALRSVYGDDDFEHWNAGVESFNTVQEVAYYRRFNRVIEPDHVVLTFHNNDFSTTPIAFLNDSGELVVYSSAASRVGVNPTLLRHSSLYRLLLSATMGTGDDGALFEDQVRAALTELRGLAEADGARLTVLVLPILKGRARWSREEVRNHETALRILADLGIRHFDLTGPLEEASARGVPINEVPGDTWHPSDQVARVFAEYLHEQGLLEVPDR